MAVSRIKAVFPTDIQRVWDVVTDVEHYTWRSDVNKTEILSETQFVEYSLEGVVTTFTVTAVQPRRRWEFDLRNENIEGHWSGTFMPRGEETEIEFVEQVKARKFWMRPFIALYLKRQQRQFVADCKKALLR